MHFRFYNDNNSNLSYEFHTQNSKRMLNFYLKKLGRRRVVSLYKAFTELKNLLCKSILSFVVTFLTQILISWSIAFVSISSAPIKHKEWGDFSHILSEQITIFASREFTPQCLKFPLDEDRLLDIHIHNITPCSTIGLIMIYGLFKFHTCFILWYLWLPKAVWFPAPLKAAAMFQQQKPHISKIVFLVSLF